VTRLFILWSFGDGVDPLYYVGPISIANTQTVGARAHHKGGLGLNPGVVILYPLLLPTLFLTVLTGGSSLQTVFHILLLVGAEGG
jgi:hypothetical protein